MFPDAALALLPMLVLGPIAGQELVQPMAIVMIGGLITTALATLYVVPEVASNLAMLATSSHASSMYVTKASDPSADPV